MYAGTFSSPAMCDADGSATGFVTSGVSLPRMENVNRLRARSRQCAGAYVMAYGLSRQTYSATAGGL